MGGELGGPGGKAPWFRPQHPRGGPGGLPPFRPQHLELNHFVTGSVNFFVVFHAFRNLYSYPTQNPLVGGYQGFSPTYY